jgi:selenocysteine lyase/cysteine desulfurase
MTAISATTAISAIDHAISTSFWEQFSGPEVRVPLIDGSSIRPINLDYAASTPPLRSVRKTVDRLLDWYSSVHRGTGFASQICTNAYEEARTVVARFVGARPNEHVVIFGPNTTWALNKLARRIAFAPDAIILSTELEHHANDLPWRQVAQVIHIQADANGQLDVAQAAALLQQYAGRVRLLAVTGGSNVTGVLPPIHRLAELAHAVGAEIVVDCAQLAPHRPIDMGELADPQHLDYIAFSGHKLYAPYGSGVLVGRRDTFAIGAPDAVGGGTVRRVTPDAVEWADAPASEEAGTPNLIGAVAIAAALRELEQIGFDQIVAHEVGLTAYALAKLAEIPGVQIYGNADPARAHERLGVIPLAVDGVDHRLAAAVLSYEHGVAVRSGGFCAHPYVQRLLELADAGCSTGEQVPGLLRVSIGLATTAEDIDALADALNAVASGNHAEYRIDPADGSLRPIGWNEHPTAYFSLYNELVNNYH